MSRHLKTITISTRGRDFKNLFLSSFSAILFSLPFYSAKAASPIYIPIGEAKIKRSIVAFPATKYLAEGMDSGDKKATVRTLKDAITYDLDFTTLFKFQSEDAFIEKPSAGITLETFQLSDWSTIGTEFLIKTGITIQKDNISYELRLYDVVGKKQILGKRYVGKTNEIKTIAHTVANDIVEGLTGKKGFFFTKIAMVCEKTGKKEIWLTDFDGTNPTQLTHHSSLAFSPAWSPSGNKLAYSVYTKNAKNVKNIDLYEYDFASKKARLLSNRPGINSGADYSPDGDTIALTMSFLGNAEIFQLNSKNLKATRITNNYSDDVDPAFSPDGKRMAFVSSRSQQPMVYTMNTSGEDIQRITFAGKYNATPRWSPNSKKLVFAGHEKDHFDLFLINADGTKLERLTKDEGSNEDPDFSPDGSFVVFTSSRSNQKNVYMITVDGQFTRRISHGLGNCQSPRWSPAKQ